MNDPTKPTDRNTAAKVRDKLTAKALLVWGTGVLLYTMAVTGRTSFGVASVEAMDQFHIDANQLAVFATLQLGTYSLAQIPVGLLVDRFGPRKLLIAGALIMGVGQVVLAFSGNYALALFARVLVGAGDATAFSSLMRLVPAWIPLRLTPLFSQLSGALGQFGQFLSAVPFMALLNTAGWTNAFLSFGAMGLLLALIAFVLIQDSPEDPSRKRPKQSQQQKGMSEKPAEGKASTGPRTMEVFASVVKDRVCWHGFFVHWVGLGTLVVFTMLWGLPIMTLGLEQSHGFAGMALTLATVGTVLAGPFVGIMSARVGQNRWTITLAGSGLAMLGWLWLFAPAEHRGATATMVVVILMGVFAPVSNLGFDSVRERVPRQRLATGTGLANMGGWTAGMISAQIMGLSLSLTAPDGSYHWPDFRIAWVVVVVVWIFGVIGVLLTRPDSKRLPAMLRRLKPIKR